MYKFFVLLVILISNVLANEYLETPSFQGVHSKVTELRTRYSANEILIALDIDNTLLKARQSLGSDQWFEWQSDAIAKGTPEASYKTFEELLRAQAGIYQMSSMSLTEPSLPQVIQSFRQAGHSMFLLTSRSPELRNVTERELKRNGLWFSDIAVMKGIPEDILEAPFKNPVSYMNGVFMTAGHHKGEALDYIVKKSGRSFKAIIFVDDHARHTRRVYDLFNTRPDIEILTFRYSMEDARVQSFKEGPKNQVLSEARTLETTISQIFK